MTAVLADFVTLEIHRIFLVFVRVAAAIAFLPGLGEAAVPVRVRLGIAGLAALAIGPAVPGLPAAAPAGAGELVPLFAGEMLVGGFIGIGARLFLASLQIAGTVIGQTIGLANPFAVQGTGFEGGSVVSTGLVIAGLAMVFATDVHYLMLEAVVRSYTTWPVAEPLETGPLARDLAGLIAATFRLGIGLAAPFLVFAVLFNLALGLVNRVMPALPVFFVGTPIMLGLGLLMLALSAGAMISGFAAAIATWLAGG